MFACAFAVVLCAFGIAGAQSTATNGATAADIVAFLSKTISWYRQLAVEQQIATDPGDVTFFDQNRRVSNQVVQLAFDFARAQEEILSRQKKAKQPQQSDSLTQYQGLAQRAQQADQQVQQSQAEVDALKKKLEVAPARTRHTLESQIAETQSELALLQARRDVLHNMVDFVNGTAANGLGASGLRGQIEELARSVPSAFNQASTQSASSNVAARERPQGLWGLTADLFTLSHKIHVLDGEIAATNALTQASKSLRTPMVANLKQLIQQGDNLANQPDSTDSSVLAQQKGQMDAMTTQFKQIAAGLLPLGKQGVLLNFYTRSLTNWRDAVNSDYREDLRGLLIRVLVLLAVVGIVIGVGEIWRRTIFRYVHDGRRRYQLLLLRRIVIWISIAIIIALAFATELSSVATFAGLLTAGVAVALQNVILSVAGYFLLIGKYGIRVGDRVQIAGVTGEVVDVGLVRLHLLELGTSGTDSQPSGRIVAFSNSIVFQPTSGLFKQIPGANFVWHEITLTFAPESEYHVVKQRIAKALDVAFSKYREYIERQSRQMEASVNSLAAIEIRPRTRVHYSATGVEAVVHFPVEPQRASEIDDQVMHELLAEIEREPKLKLAGSAAPILKTDLPASVAT
jgi:small-conductance mechanosensitive channel